jgi:hypothetical protein
MVTVYANDGSLLATWNFGPVRIPAFYVPNANPDTPCKISIDGSPPVALETGIDFNQAIRNYLAKAADTNFI